ncbi:MAG: diguanylate cyclase (GGDEF)-like protein, partial [Mariniblastus sp.]
DRAIKHIADWLKKNIRQNDAAIRIGGDEFIVVMQSVTKKDFESAANRIASKIPPMPSSGEDINIRMSVGCVFYQPLRGDTRDINWLIDHADQAMYAAKKSGGNSALIQHFKGIEAVVV